MTSVRADNDKPASTIGNTTWRSGNCDAIAELQDFIAACRDAREARKALAVKLIYQDYLYEEIQAILDVSLGSIT
ncbi:hypothetical protein F8S20_20660, partial [Nostoc sp. BAE]|nr:hypothetical protein [Nostoc commune BAE]